MKFTFLFLALIGTCAASSAPPSSLPELEVTLKATNVFNSSTIGAELTGLISATFQAGFLHFEGAQFTLTADMLTVNAKATLWSVPSTIVTQFWFADSQLQMSLQFELLPDSVGGLAGIFSKLLNSSVPTEIGKYVTLSNEALGFSVNSTGPGVGCTVFASADVSSSSPWGQAILSLFAKYVNPLDVSFTFRVGKAAVAHRLQSFSSFSWSWHVPGAYNLAAGLEVDNIVFTATSLVPPAITVQCDVNATIDGASVIFATSGSLNNGVVSLTGSLSSPWSHPLGLTWFTANTATVSMSFGGKTPPPTAFSISGSGALSWVPNNSVAFTLAIGDITQGLYALSITGVPVFGFGGMYQAITGKTASPSVSGVHTTGTAGIAIATYNAQGISKGLALTATVTVSSGHLYSATHMFHPTSTPGQLQFAAKLSMPIFTSPGDFTLTITETDPFHIGSRLVAQDLNFGLSKQASSVSLNVAAELLYYPPKSTAPATWSLSGNYAGGSTLTLSANLETPWTHAFGASWLTVNTCNGNLVLGTSPSFSVSGQVTATFGSHSVSATASLQSGASLDDISFSLTVEQAWEATVVANAIAGTNVPRVQDIKVQDDIKYGIAISDYSGQYREGITLSFSGKIVGATLGAIKTVNPTAMPTLTWNVQFYVPTFGANPTAWELNVNVADQIAVTKHLDFESVALTITDADFDLSGVFQSTFTNNPNVLTWDLDGNVATSGAITLDGEMKGTWPDVFGIHGFSLSNVVAKVQFNPDSCVTGFGCIDEFGLGFTTTFGTKTVKFAGQAAAPDFLKCFLLGSVSASKGVVLGVGDLASEWNKMAPAHPINMATVPKDWGLQSALIQIAGSSGTFGPYTYTEGFSIQATILMLGLTEKIGVACSVSKLTPNCNFNFHVNLDISAFWNELKSHLHLLDQSRNQLGHTWSMQLVKMDDFDTASLSTGAKVGWELKLQVDVFGDKKHFDIKFGAELVDLAGTFGDFFDKFIKDHLHI